MDNKDGTYSGEYLPVLHGEHKVNVDLAGHPLAHCPITVKIDRDQNSSDPSKTWAELLNEPTTIEPVKVFLFPLPFFRY